MKKVLFVLSILTFGFVESYSQKDIIRSIYFGGGSFGIDQEQVQSLKELVESIKNIEYYEISITSHTDNIGGREFNEYLSRMRSQSVIDQLENLKVPSEIIKYKDYGFDKPIFDNRTWEGRLNNRRVDILFRPLVF